MATPLQAPPHALPSLAHAVRAPCGAPVTAEQLPTEPGTSHAWHWPPQAALQHTPSTQLPLAHWFVAEQTCPFPFLATQAPAAQ